MYENHYTLFEGIIKSLTFSLLKYTCHLYETKFSLQKVKLANKCFFKKLLEKYIFWKLIHIYKKNIL